MDCVYVRVFEPVHVAPVNCCPMLLDTGWVGAETCVFEFGCIGACGELAKPFCWMCGDTGELFPVKEIVRNCGVLRLILYGTDGRDCFSRGPIWYSSILCLIVELRLIGDVYGICRGTRLLLLLLLWGQGTRGDLILIRMTCKGNCVY